MSDGFDDTRLQTVAGAFRAGAQSYAKMGSPLYSALCAGGADDPDIIVLAAHAMAGSQPVFHLLASVHHLLLGDPSDPLARFFATLTDDPAPAGQAWPDFARFCRAHGDEILQLLANNTVQTTYAERCVPLVPAIAWVADRAGEPLNLIEIGCSAGVLLTFDKYRYVFDDREPVGPRDAPLTFAGSVIGDPPLRIPRIGQRVGLDLHPVDAASEEQRRWLIAQTFPEYREQRANLSTALDTVNDTDIRMVAGGALETLPAVLADLTGPLCIFHSACLYYWTAEAKVALDELLKAASADREIYRVGLEASEGFNAWHKGSGSTTAASRPAAAGEIVIAHYRDGEMDRRIVAQNSMGGPIIWLDGVQP